jgi:hypothetical protein
MLVTLLSGTLRAQDLEPRYLSPAPVGMNFVLAGYTYSRGNVLLDAALPLEGTDAQLHAITLAYARSIDVFGLSGRLSAVVPVANGTWHAEFEGVDTSTARTGFGDPMVVFAVNFLGAPALRGADFAGFQAKTIVGADLKVRIPIGQYDRSKLFNLGTGRWNFSPRLGLAHNAGRFVFEGYVSGWFFTTNKNFFGGNTLSQDVLVGFQLHVSYLFRRGFWGAVSFGQGVGGATTVNGEEIDNEQTNNRVGATLAIPITSHHSLKAVFTSGITTRAGADFDTLVIAWQYRWGGLPGRPAETSPAGR